MANQEENSLPSPQFFKLFLPQNIDHSGTKFKLPSSFVKEHGNSLCDYAYLQVPTGALAWKVELKRRERRVWLHKGWQDFVEYYSIKFGYFLMSRYEGESCFRVFIFDTTTMEIQYPVGAASTSRERDQSKAIQIKEEDTNDDEYEEVARTGQSSESKSRHFTKAMDNVLERAKAFNSQYPCFITRMRPSHVSDIRSLFYFPESHIRNHFLEKENNGIYLTIGEDRRYWFVKYFFTTHPRLKVRILTSGWSKFMKENHLQVGDVCVFELIDSNTMTYKITIFRVADYA